VAYYYYSDLIAIGTLVYLCQADPYGRVVARSGNLKRENCLILAKSPLKLLAP
jgi:hypothetical protein